MSWHSELDQRLLAEHTTVLRPEFAGMWDNMPKTAKSIIKMMITCKVHNYDLFYVVYSDVVRSGKSTLCQLIMMLNPLFSSHNTVYHGDSFNSLCDEAKPAQCFPAMCDEPDLLYNHVLSNAHMEIKKKINRIGYKNMMFGLCTSDLTMIPWYVLEKRARAIFYVTERGEFNIISSDQITNKIKDRGKFGYELSKGSSYENWTDKDFLNPVFVKIRAEIDAKKEEYDVAESLKKSKFEEIRWREVVDFYGLDSKRVKEPFFNSGIDYSIIKRRGGKSLILPKKSVGEYITFLFENQKITKKQVEDGVAKWHLK